MVFCGAHRADHLLDGCRDLFSRSPGSRVVDVWAVRRGCVTFSECYDNRKEVTFDGLSMNFIGYHDLVKNKRATGRHRDLDDLENIGPDK